MTIFVPGQLVNPTNARWFKWRQRDAWARTWRDATANALLTWWVEHGRAEQIEAQRLVGQPVTVTLEARVARRFNAHDNLRAALKPVVDAVAAALGTTDEDERVAWVYAPQAVERDPKRRGVVVRVTAITAETLVAGESA
jgi:hypothetical protein